MIFYFENNKLSLKTGAVILFLKNVYNLIIMNKQASFNKIELFVFCLLLACGPTIVSSASSDIYFMVDIYTGSTCSGSPTVPSFFPYTGECFPQTSGQIKFSSADEIGATLCLYNAPVDKTGCNPGFEVGCSKIAYDTCTVFPAQPFIMSAKFRRVFVASTPSPPSHYTVMSWNNNKCASAPAGKLPGESPTPNSLGVYPYRILMNITDTSGANPPTGVCESALCGSTVCWIWRTSSTGGSPPSAHICSNGQISLGGTNCNMATQCSSFALDGTTCVVPTNQPLVLISNTARFDVVLSNSGNGNGNGSGGGAGILIPYHYGMFMVMFILVVAI